MCIEQRVHETMQWTSQINLIARKKNEQLKNVDSEYFIILSVYKIESKRESSMSGKWCKAKFVDISTACSFVLKSSLQTLL